MADSQVMLYILVALTGLSLLACVALLLRKPKMEMPPELSARMTLLEQSVVRVVEGQGRLEGGSQSVERRLQAFTEETAAAFASSRQALDEQLGRTVEESRSGRVELQAAFQKFEERLDGRISALDQKLGNRFSEFQETIAQGPRGQPHRGQRAAQQRA
jgi:DNA recombination protein RmuC